jgi:hypothetical protein
LFAGIARFGQDTNPNAPGPAPLGGDPDYYIEDGANRFDGSIEVDAG